MKFVDWYNFNFVENKIMDRIGDIYVKIFRKESYQHEDMILCSLVNFNDAVKLFGDMKLMKVTFHSEHSTRLDGQYKALCALLCMEEKTDD
jgi:hypothetical protein